MKALYTVALLVLLAMAGCSEKKPAGPPESSTSPAGAGAEKESK